jgi:hypothetical protein
MTVFQCLTGVNLAAQEQEPARRKQTQQVRGSPFPMNRFTEAVNDLTLRADNQSDWVDFSMLGICYLNLDRPMRRFKPWKLCRWPGQGAILDTSGRRTSGGGECSICDEVRPGCASAPEGPDYDQMATFITTRGIYLFKRYPEAKG